MGTSGTWAKFCLEPRIELSPKWGVKKAGRKPFVSSLGVTKGLDACVDQRGGPSAPHKVVVFAF